MNINKLKIAGQVLALTGAVISMASSIVSTKVIDATIAQKVQEAVENLTRVSE